MQSDILLATLNARYHHCSFGLRYLYANLHEFQGRARISEFTISEAPKDIVEKILLHRPKIVGLGVYIWNTEQTLQVISILKRVSPEIVVVLGGPEVSHETDSQPICHAADYVIQGEADFLFYQFCKAFFSGVPLPAKKWISGELPDIKRIVSPYAFYSQEDISNRVIYVEASRGCPYKCEYCLSSLDKSVRNFELEPFLADLDLLISKGARQFKFVDRTFNLSMATGTKILKFFLERIRLGLFIHFELVPDRLPEELRDLIQQFPAGSLQFEIGIQTWNSEVSKLISRRQDLMKIQENFKFLKEKTGVHTHADLIVGLPGETLESFAAGFDSLAQLNPDEIQVGILKRLKGTPIIRHDCEWGMVYQEHPPFQILKTSTMDFETIQKMGRFSKFWDLIANSGNFTHTMELFKTLSLKESHRSLFWFFYEFCEFLKERHPQSHSIALLNLVESVWMYLTESQRLDAESVRDILLKDYTGKVSRDIPKFLRSERAVKEQKEFWKNKMLKIPSSLPDRQRKHLMG